MPKHDFLTAKAIGNRIKAKGLQKLRWFCQVCQKQCRDENGFKCHTKSESHQRQMLVVAQNPDKFIGGYSEMFESSFLDMLKRRHGTKRVRANTVYNEYIADKLHIHMNSTQWTTLSGFVQFLGRSGKCSVDETEKGWYIQYIDRDPKVLARQAALDKKEQAELHHEERNRRFIENQVLAAKGNEKEPDKLTMENLELKRKDNGEKIRVDLPSSSNQSSTVVDKEAIKGNIFIRSKPQDSSSFEKTQWKGKRKTALDDLMNEEQERKKQVVINSKKTERKENWISRNIIIKIMSKELDDGRFYKKKGLIVDVEEKFVAHVQILGCDIIIKIDQDDLETVIPKIGARVKIVNGYGRGNIGTLLSLDIDAYVAKIRIETGSKQGQIIDKVEYEDISKLDEEAYRKSKD